MTLYRVTMPRRIAPAPYHSGRPKSKLVNFIICNDHGFKPAAHDRKVVRGHPRNDSPRAVNF